MNPAAQPEAFLRALFDAAVAAADPMRVVPAALPHRPVGRVVVVGAGKASARMAEAVETAWGPCEGLVITRTGHGRPTRGIEVVEAAHPVPDEAGLAATTRIMALLQGCGEGDTVVALISGGASALLVAPVAGVSLADKQAVGRALLDSGAPIGRMNIVRKHLSRVKGGQLAAMAYPARMLALMISDVPGDDPAAIGSGPATGEASGPDDAARILAEWRIDPPAAVAAALARPSGVIRPGDPRLSRVEARVIAAPAQSLNSAAALARSAGCMVEVMADDLQGEARQVGFAHAGLARQLRVPLRPGSPPILLLSGGELTVTRRGGDGIGGPNAEYALALALALGGTAGVHALACDTDGIDGAAPVAGAVIGPDILTRAPGAAEALAGHDAHTWFAAAGAQVVTGPTLTNVNDFHALLILPRKA